MESIIFSGTAHPEFARKVSEHSNIPLGRTEINRFKDGEIWVKFVDNVRLKHVFLIQPTFPPAENLLELLIMIDAAKRASAWKITVVIPYYGYARQDRKDEPRVAITARLIADMLESAGASRVLTMDLHVSQIQGFFNIPVDHIYYSMILADKIRDIGITDLVVVSPDVGGVKMARAYSKKLKADLAIIDKRRPDKNKVDIMNIIGNIEGKNVILVDDIIDTGGTVVKAAEALKKNGAKNIFAACSHPLFSADAVEKLRDSVIEKIFVSDTIPLGDKIARSGNKIEVTTTTKLFANAVKNIATGESVSSLFTEDDK
ncbi:MAG: ribose-phosphate pyrophosphokinase [Calditrichaeota bacterium]|nr:MAG: ribose-phosphate pyrophosphokinase [Calditrichota bacterium]